MTYWGGKEKRPQNCGTGYCSCIECPYETTIDAWEKYAREAGLVDEHGMALASKVQVAKQSLKTWEAAIEYARNSCAKEVELTDDEIAQAVGSPLDEVYLADFRAVIAADRRKNGIV